MELDFSGLNKLTRTDTSLYRPKITASEAQNSADAIQTISISEQALKRKIQAFTDTTGARNYNDIYRAAHECHRRHYPPVVDREYWRTHTGEAEAPEGEIAYWRGVYEDILQETQKQKDDPLLVDLLVAVYRDLEREYERLRRQ